MRTINEIVGIFLGILLLAGVHIAVILLLGILSYASYTIIGQSSILFGIWFASFSYIGLFQLLYVIPIVLWLRRQERWGLLKGVIIGAVITALLNGGCSLLTFEKLGSSGLIIYAKVLG